MAKQNSNSSPNERETINGVKIGFPGIGNMDCPFQVSEGVPLAGALQEVSALLNGAIPMLKRIDSYPDEGEVEAIAFLLQSADALIASLTRGFESHPLVQGDDGYHTVSGGR